MGEVADGTAENYTGSQRSKENRAGVPKTKHAIIHTRMAYRKIQLSFHDHM